MIAHMLQIHSQRTDDRVVRPPYGGTESQAASILRFDGAPYGRLTSAAYLRSIDRAFTITPRSEIVPVSNHWL